MFAVDGGVENLLQAAGNRPHLAAANGAEIDLTHRNQLGGCAADEDLIRNIELIPRDGLFEHLEPLIAGQGNGSIPGDPFQDGGGGWSIDLPITHQEQVL